MCTELKISFELVKCWKQLRNIKWAWRQNFLNEYDVKNFLKEHDVKNFLNEHDIKINQKTMTTSFW